MKKLKFIVFEKPLSQNQVYKRSKWGGLHMTTQGHNYKTMVGWEAKKAMLDQETTLFTNPKVSIIFKWSDKRVHDVDGAIKLTLDALNEICWEDDSCIQDLHVYKRKGAKSVQILIVEE